jgi:hypothetical protein
LSVLYLLAIELSVLYLLAIELSVLYLLAIELSVPVQITAFDYPFGIFFFSLFTNCAFLCAFVQ